MTATQACRKSLLVSERTGVDVVGSWFRSCFECFSELRARVKMQMQIVKPSGKLANVCVSARSIRHVRPRRLAVCSSTTQTAKRTTKKEAIKEARDEVRDLIKSRHCNPILVRVAWHDSGTYDKVGQRTYATIPGTASRESQWAL